jgi:hypothetical protein
MQKRRTAIKGDGKSTVLLFSFVLIFVFLAFHQTAFAGLFDDAVSGEAVVAQDDESAQSGGETTTQDELSTPDDRASISPDVPTAVDRPLKYELNGYIRGTIYAGKVPNRDDAEIKNAYAEPALKLRIKKGDFGDAFAETRFRFGYDGETTSPQLDLREAYVNVYPGPFDIRLGHQVIVWGRADGINPTNNLTPFTWRMRSPYEDDQKLGNLALRAYYNLAPFRLEGVWIPLYRATELPKLPFPDFISLTEDYPEPRIQNGLVAARAHLELPVVEMSISYLYGYSPMPGFVLESIGQDTTGALSIVLARTPYRHHVVGFDFSTVVGDLFGLRGEAAYRYPEEEGDLWQTPVEDIYYVLGVDREFGDIMIIAQYIGRYAWDWQWAGRFEGAESLEGGEITDIAAAQSILARVNQLVHGQPDEWQHSVSGRISWDLLYQTLSLELSGLFNFNTEEWTVRPRASYDLTDSLEFALGAELFGGPTDSLFGAVDSIQSAGYVQLIAWF